MRILVSMLAVSIGLTFAPTAATARAGFLPGQAKAEANFNTKSKAEREADRQRRIELREKRRELRRLKRIHRQKTEG